MLQGPGSTSELIECSDELCGKVLDAATDVHRCLGPGLLESIYEKALVIELAERNISARCQVEVPVFYKGVELGKGYYADIVVEDCLLLELKSVEQLTPVPLAQVMTYQKLLQIKRGYLLNFNTRLLKHGIKRVSI